MVTLYCGVVRVAGTAFPVDIDGNNSVGHMKEVIKEKKMYQFPADQLQLFLAKKGGEWLTEEDVAKGVEATDGLTQLLSARAEIGDVGLSEDDVRVQVTKEALAAQQGPVNVLVVVPEGGKRHPSNRWFAESSHPLKKREDVDEERRFFDMRGFPPLLWRIRRWNSKRSWRGRRML
jgi:hypothetical protein